LTQREVLTLAKTAARKVVRQKIYDYDITSVILTRTSEHGLSCSSSSLCTL
jgi:hypothetical protein